MSTEAAGAERHAAPAWQSWGVISVCRLQEGVTAAWPRENGSQLVQGTLAFSTGKKSEEVLQQGAQRLLGQTGDPKRQKASFAKRGGTRPSTNQVLSVSGGLSGPLPPITADRDHFRVCDILGS